MDSSSAVPKQVDTQVIAREVLVALDQAHQISTLSSRLDGFDLASAYRAGSALRDLRVARGEQPVGRKIGFTNSSIWPEYGVWAPIWGPMYRHTVQELAAINQSFSLAALCEPRIEPEIVFSLASAPQPGMDDAALLGCIDWLAHGFEIVHSIYPGWKFAAADTVAAGSLHGALLMGPRHPIQPGSDWLQALSSFRIELLCDGQLADQGSGANVLGSPLSALRHLVELLAQSPDQPPLQPGEIITTGTLTRALPITSGQCWETRLSGIALEGISVQFS